MKRLSLILGFIVLSTTSWSQPVKVNYSFSLAPANNGWFYLVVVGPEGLKKTLGYNPESENLDIAAQLGKKLQLALNNQSLNWEDVSEELLKRLVEPTPDNGYVDPSTVKAYDTLATQYIDSYSVTIAPAQGSWFYLLVVGPEGIIKEMGFNPESENLDKAILLGRNLESALNSNRLMWKNITSQLLVRITEPPPLSGYVDFSTFDAFQTIKEQLVRHYSVTVAPTNGGSFYLVVAGPEGIMKQWGYNPESENLDRAFLFGRSLEEALNRNLLRWEDVSYALLSRLTEPISKNGYVDSSTVKAFNILERLMSISRESEGACAKALRK